MVPPSGTWVDNTGKMPLRPKSICQAVTRPNIRSVATKTPDPNATRRACSGLMVEARAVGRRRRAYDALECGAERLEGSVAALLGYIAQLAFGGLEELARSIHALSLQPVGR